MIGWGLRKHCYTTMVAAALAATTCPAWAQEADLCKAYDHMDEGVRNRSVVFQVKKNEVVDANLQEKFGFEKTLKAILKRAGRDEAEVVPLLTTLLESFQTEDDTERQPNSVLPMKVDARPGEAGLKAEDLLNPAASNGLVPVGLFNRFDLADASVGHCGEARIVFAKPKQPENRMLLIFEGKVTPVAKPSDIGVKGCLDVAKFWAGLAALDDGDRADRLEKFFFEGDLGPGLKPLAIPPMSYENLGGTERGQVRGDLFVNGEWQLREWLIKRHGDRLAFDVETVKDNPLAEFFDKVKSAGQREPTRFAAELADFQTEFVTDMMKGLVSNNAVGSGSAVRALPTDIQMVHGFGLGGATVRYDEFQSTSQGGTDLVDADAEFEAAIQKSGGELGSRLSPKQIVNRARALTCHGCHQPEGVTRPEGFKLEIAPGVNWPASLGFVHIDEDSDLSPALKESFLPFRAALLKDALCEEAAPTVAEAGPEMVFLRKAAPVMKTFSTNIESLTKQFEAAQTTSERAIVSDLLKSQQNAARQFERSQPGTFWRFRRTH